MKDPRAGDRVAVYNDGSRRLGTVQKVDGDGLLKEEGVLVELDHISVPLWFHHKQLRRLVKKKREERWTMEEIESAWCGATEKDGFKQRLLRIAAERKKEGKTK